MITQRKADMQCSFQVFQQAVAMDPAKAWLPGEFHGTYIHL